jgi:hypothetical protein
MMQPLRAALSSLSPLPLILAGCAALVLAGCAEAPPPPLTSPSGAAEPPPSLFGAAGQGTSPVDNEMLAIGKAEAELDRALPRAAKELARKGAPTPAGEQKKDGPGDKASDPSATPLNGEGDGCATACRALASMARSADHLCSLAGEGDGRCDDARGRVRGATARVRSACPTCAAQP